MVQEGIPKPVRCAFISLHDHVFEGGDDSLLAAELQTRGWEVTVVDWKNPTVCWNDYDVAVMRSPWDYHLAPEAFSEFLNRISASKCLLLNPSDLIAMNLDKRYLLEFARRCDVVIPTLLHQRGLILHHDSDQLKPAGQVSDFIRQSFEKFRVDEVVVKPTVGAGSDRTLRVTRREVATLGPTLQQIAMERDLLIQPFLETITDPGEFSLIFIEGEYFHCILKRPKAGDFRVQSQHGGIYERAEPDSWMISTSRELLRNFAPTAVYARLDWVLHPDMSSPIPFLLMEMELIEPDLYLRYTNHGISHFSNALVRAYELGRAKKFVQSN